MEARSPVLVVSIDGVAPRHVTRATMPTLTTLAREGASCFGARAVEPPWTLPVHTTMFCGIDPATHGVRDNAPIPLTSEAPSFLKAGRAAGRTTAMFVNWAPFDAVIERDAAEHRFVIDGGYDPDEDRRLTDAAIATLAEDRHDLALVYLALPDLVGHDQGWDSDEYVRALTITDTHLGRLLEVLGPAWSVLVTTDHGGVDRNHADLVPDVLETFVVVRAPGRVAPATCWSGVTTLAIAPTVADLVGFEPDPRWEGRSLLGSEVPIVDLLLER
ncbi:MAG: alkaline phosphatase family protein, partial [Acidimicrobiales bacterium]|nr:alkaline phosphatase family protein [Acidimicrobiales bacterium]